LLAGKSFGKPAVRVGVESVYNVYGTTEDNVVKLPRFLAIKITGEFGEEK